MPHKADVKLSGSILSTTYSFDVSSEGEQGWPVSTTVPAGAAGSLTTRTSDTAGTVTAASGSHGVTTGEVVDLYWTGGARRNVTVGTVSGTAVPVSGGTGTVLPTANTAVTVAKQKTESGVSVATSTIQAIAAKGQSGMRTTYTFRDGSNAVLFSFTLDSNVDYLWTRAGGTANPLGDSATLASVSVTHDSTTSKVGVVGVIFS